MQLKDLFEARDPKKTYHFHEVKKKVERISVSLEGTESAVFTRLAKRYKEIDAELKKLQTERNALNEETKAKVLSYFDAEDEVLTRVVETVSMTASMSKMGKSTPKVDHEKVLMELVSLMPELEDKIKELSEKCSEMSKPKAPSLTIDVKEGVKDVWEAIKKSLVRFLADIKLWGKSFDKKLNTIKKQAGLVAENYYPKINSPEYHAAANYLQKKPMKIKIFMKKLRDSTLPQKTIDDIAEVLDGHDGDKVVSRTDIEQICAIATADLGEVLDIIGMDDKGQVTEAKENNPPKRPVKPKDGLKVGLELVPSKTPSNVIHIGDWVKITDGGHKDEYGYIVGSNKTERTDPTDRKFKIDISDSKTPEIVLVPMTDVKIEKKYHDNPAFGKVAEKGKQKVDKAALNPEYFEASDGNKYFFLGKTSAPNMKWKPSSNPLKVLRTDEDRAKSKEYLDNLKKILSEFLKFTRDHMEDTSTYKAEKQQMITNAEKVLAALQAYDKSVDKFNALSKRLNTASKKNDAEDFGKAVSELKELCGSLRNEIKVLKTKQRLPEFMGAPRTLAAKGFDYMFSARDHAEKYLKRMGMSDAKKAAADKASANMRARWAE